MSQVAIAAISRAQVESFHGGWWLASSDPKQIRHSAFKTIPEVSVLNITELVAERHQLRTQLERTVADAERYRKLRAQMLAEQVIVTVGKKSVICVESFDAAVDALPEPDIAHLSCPDCAKCKRHAYSDATTPGFFYDRCEKHRRPEPEEK